MTSAEKKCCNKHNVPSELLSDSEMREITRLGRLYERIINRSFQCEEE